MQRTPIRSASGGHPNTPCDGAYSFHMTQDFMRARGLAAGQNVHLQWWSRDPQASFSTGLSDAASVIVGP